MNPIIVAKYDHSALDDDGSESVHTYYFFKNIKTELGDKISENGRCKKTHLLAYLEDNGDFIKGVDYKITLELRHNMRFNNQSNPMLRFRNPVSIESDKLIYYKEKSRYFRKDKISGSVKEFDYYKAMRH